MNRDIKANQAKLPVKARIGKRIAKVNVKGPFLKNARTKGVQGNISLIKKPTVKITRTIESGKGVNIKNRTLIARGGRIMRINRNVPLNTGKNFVKPVGKKILQTKNMRNIKRNKPVHNFNPSNRKVEFDDQSGGLEVQNAQDDFMGNINYIQNDLMGNVNYGFEDMSFSNSALLPTPSLLPTPLVQQRIFPPVHEGPFHNNQQDLINDNINHLRELERQKAQEDLDNLRELERRESERKKAQEELRALERKRIKQKMFEEEQRRFEEEQRQFVEEQRQYEEEQRRIDDERKNLDRLRKSLENEKRDLEILKKTVEEEEELEKRRSISKGREMANERFGGFDSNSNRWKQKGKGNIAQNWKSQDVSSKPSDSFRMPAPGLFDYIAKINKNENRERFDSVINNDHNRYGMEDFNPTSQSMPTTGLLDYMLDKPLDARGSEREELGRDFRGRGGERGRNFGSRRGKRGGGNKNMNFNSSGKGRGANTNTRRGGGGRGWGGKNNKKSYDQNSKFNDSERGYNTRDSSPRPHKMSSAPGLMEYMLDKQSRGAPGSNWGGNFNQSNDFDNTSRERGNDHASRGRVYEDASRGRGYDDVSRGREYDDTSRGREYDDSSRGREYNFSWGNNEPAYSFQRDSSRDDEMTSNQNQNYGNQTESGYQILSRGFKAFKNDEQKPEYQNPQNNNNSGSYQESFGGHPYYDNFYDQGRISRNYNENSGRLDSLGKQGTFSGTSFPSNSGENKFGFVGFPFKNKSPIYEVPRKSEKNYSSNQGVAGYASNSTNQQEKPADSFYSYRPGDNKNNDSSKSGRSGTDGFNILGVGTSLPDNYSGNSSANFGHNLSKSHGGSDFFGKVVRNDNTGSRSYPNFDSANNAVNMDMKNDSQEYIKELKKKRKNFQHNLNNLPPSRFRKKQTVLEKLQLVNDEISRLENQYGQNID